MEYDKVIKGTIVLEEEVKEGSIGISNGKIKTINLQGTELKGEESVDFTGKYIFPGVIDVHVHCFSNPNEGFEKTSKLAAAGGVTTFLDMPYDVPDPVNNVSILKRKLKALENEAIVDIGLWGTISKYNGTDEIKPLIEEGVMSFKMSTFETDPKRFPRIPNDEVIKAMELLRDSGILVAFHSEDDEIVKGLTKKYKDEGKVYYKAHNETRPPYSETSAVLTLLEFAYWTRCKLHIVHVSHPRTLEIIEEYKEKGVDVTAETCYTYLLLNVEHLEEYGPFSKMNPPVRYSEDVEAMWEHLKRGNIDLISSDHIAWEVDSKEKGMDDIFQAPSGLPGLEVIAPLMFDAIVNKHDLSPSVFANLLSVNPAKIFNIEGKGRIEEGYDADFVVIDPDKSWEISKDTLNTNAKLLPLDNYRMQGKVINTIVRGKTVYDGVDIVVDPGYGTFIQGSGTKR